MAPAPSRGDVAAASGITVDWYARIEQGRAPGLTEATLTATCRALGLDGLEIDYARRLLAAAHARRDDRGSSPLPASIRDMVAGMRDTPAYVIDARWRIRGHNRAATVLLDGLDGLRGVENNCLWQHYLNRRFRDALEEPEGLMAYLAALFRYTTAHHAGASWRIEVVEGLAARSGEFERIWSKRGVADWGETEKAFRHPTLGRLRFINVSHEVAAMGGERFRVVSYVPVVGSGTAENVLAETTNR